MANHVPVRPSVVRIGSQDFTLHWTREEWVKLYPDEEEMMDNSSGWTKVHDNRIFIHPAQSISQKRSTLVHELFHGALHQTNYRNQCLKKMTDIEEHTVLMLEPFWLMILRDNPGLIEWLQGK